jgi:molybdopterin converting factor small subunit
MAKILYFANLVDKLGSSSEEVSCPHRLLTRKLLSWLRTRGGNWETELTEPMVRVTVNRQFAAPETSIDNTTEIAIIPARPG